MFSIYKSIMDKTPLDVVSVEEVYTLFTMENENIKKMRNHALINVSTNAPSSKKALQELKKQLPCITVGGVFKDGARSDANLLHYSGIVQIDVDVKDVRIYGILQQLKEIIAGLPYVVVCAVSPSGCGIKALGLTNNKNAQHHTQLVHQMSDAVIDAITPLLDSVGLDANAAVDRCGQALSQPMYLTWDNDTYYNPDATEWVFIPVEGWEPKSDDKKSTSPSKLKANEKIVRVSVPAVSGKSAEEQTKTLKNYVNWLKRESGPNSTIDALRTPFSTKSYYSIKVIGYANTMGVDRDVLWDFMSAEGWEAEEDFARIDDIYWRFSGSYGSGSVIDKAVKTVLPASGGVRTIPKGGYLSDVIDGHSLTDSTHIVAPTGSGKTHLSFGGPCIWVFPTTSLCQQFAHGKDAWTVWGGAPNPDGNRDLIITTYDSFARVAKEVDLSVYTVILDEVHNFITSSSVNYKLVALRNTLELLPQAGKVITLTATEFANGIKFFEGMKKIEVKKEDNFKRTVSLIKSEESRRNDVVKSVVQRGNFALIFLQTTDRNVLKQWENSFAVAGKKLIFINSQVKGSDKFIELVDKKNVDDGCVYMSTSVIAEGVSVETALEVVDVYIMESQHPYLVEQMSRRFRKIKELNVFLITNSGENKPEKLTIEDIEVRCAERREQLNKLAESMIEGFKGVGLKLSDVNIVGAPVFENSQGEWCVDELLIENYVFDVECAVLAGDVDLTIELLNKRFGYAIVEGEVMNESAKMWSVEKVGSELDLIAKTIAVGKIFGDRFEEPTDEIAKDAIKKYSRIVGKIVVGLPGITKLGRQHLMDVFNDFDVWNDKRSARFITFVRVLNSGSDVRQHYHQELINFCVAEPRPADTLKIAGTVMLEEEGLKDTDRKKMEFVMSLLMGCDVESEKRRVKSIEWKIPEEGGEMEMVEKSELVNFFRFSPLTNRQNHVQALRSLRIFGYEPGSVKEIDHDFVEAVEQVRREIPGFTF